LIKITRILSVDECIDLMDEYAMPQHIRDHSFLVRDVSVYLSKELNKKGESLDVKLIEACALVHDIAKIHCVNKNAYKDHTLEGSNILKSKGCNRMADIIEQHVNLWKKYSDIVEEEIINYSDKRVLHDKVVSLKERIDDVKIRYGYKNKSFLKRLGTIKKNAYDLETKIFKSLDFSPDDLIDLI